MEENNNKIKSKTRDSIIDMFKSLLSNDSTIPFSEILKFPNLPINGMSNTKYKGINRLILMCTAAINNYEDNRWFTFKQANEAGYKIKKNEKAIPVEFWYPWNTKDKKIVPFDEYNRLVALDSSDPEKEKLKYVMWACKTHYVFNAHQINGIELNIQKDNKTNFENKYMDYFISNLCDFTGVKFTTNNKGDKICYNHKKDIIAVPPKNKFVNEYEYYSSVMHEFAHATGAEHRLNRNLDGSFGSENYAKEELVAEIASSFISADLHLPLYEHSYSNHASYVQSWLSIIENQPEVLFTAINKAQESSDYLKEKGLYDLIEPHRSFFNSIGIDEEINQNGTYDVYIVNVSEKTTVDKLDIPSFQELSELKEYLSTEYKDSAQTNYVSLLEECVMINTEKELRLSSEQKKDTDNKDSVLEENDMFEYNGQIYAVTKNDGFVLEAENIDPTSESRNLMWIGCADKHTYRIIYKANELTKNDTFVKEDIKYYDEKLEIDGTAEELFYQARNNYISNPDTLHRISEILNNEKKYEMAEKVSFMEEREREPKELLYSVAQIKLDCLDGCCGLDDVELNENLRLYVSYDERNEEVIVHLSELKNDNDNFSYYTGGALLKFEELKKMDYREFGSFVNQIYAYNMFEQDLNLHQKKL